MSDRAFRAAAVLALAVIAAASVTCAVVLCRAASRHGAINAVAFTP